MKPANRRPAGTELDSTGVRSRDCSAGNRVKQLTHATTSPDAVQRPISRTGRISDTASAAKPTAVANIEAVHGRNLLASAPPGCTARGGPSSGSQEREGRDTRRAVVP